MRTKTVPPYDNGRKCTQDNSLMRLAGERVKKTEDDGLGKGNGKAKSPIHRVI